MSAIVIHVKSTTGAPTTVTTEELTAVPFKTARKASQAPSELMKHASNIKQGILARLLKQEGRPWTSPVLAEMNRQKYEECKGAAKAEFMRDHGVKGAAKWV